MSGTDLRERYFEAAQEILATEGYGKLKLAAVCKRLKVTTGAFYHTFESWNEFTTALLDTWLRERTTLLADLARSKTDPLVQLQTLRDVSINLNHRSEAAIRVWASVDPTVASVQAKVDHERYSVLLEVMERLVGKRAAPTYARWGINVLVGFEMMHDNARPDDLEWQLNQVLDLAATHKERAKAEKA